MDGGAGRDAATYADDIAGVTVDLFKGTAIDGWGGSDKLVSVEEVYGSDFADAITGGTAGEWIYGNAGSDSLTGGGGNDLLFGGADADSVNGGTGADRLFGGIGNDRLTGGAGADRFEFDTTPSATSGVDGILDFLRSEGDRIVISSGAFAAAGDAGTLVEEAFMSGAGVDVAREADDRLIYNTTTGALWYDADGSGNIKAVEVAILTGHPALDFTDILIAA